MGFNDSKQAKRYVQFQKNQMSTQKQFRQDQFYYHLKDMFKHCKGNIDKFFQQIQDPISKFYISLSQQTLTQMNHDEITEEQSKIIIYEEILLLNLNILKVIGQSNNFNYDKGTFKKLNKFQHGLVSYIKIKYPRGQKTLQSDELKNIFKQFDRAKDFKFDILKQSNTYFGEPDDDKIIKNIKLFINKIIIQCEEKYPVFEKMMLEEVFYTTNDRGEKGQRVKKVEKRDEVSMNCKIGRKISQNVPKYSKLNTRVLEVFSPQVFRVLIKWMEDLEDTIQNASEKINKKHSFKRYIGEKQNKKDANQKIIFDQINRDEYGQVVDKLIDRIEGIKSDLDKKNQLLIEQMGEFNESLLKSFHKVNPEQKYIPIREIETIKYSCFNAKFVEYILAEKLVFSIKELIKVASSIAIEHMMNIDPINFKVLDLMRCMFSGTKNEIIEVHQNFMKLDEKGEISIIKIKNRLSTPLNDVMIIFKMKNSWIICEAQLVLSQVGDKIHKNRKNTEAINHFFYELERSPYGIMSQISVLLTYKDTKVSYEDKITFGQSQVDIEKCKKKHNVKVQVKQEHETPFICSKCSYFYGKFQNMCKFYQCSQCKISICSKCILKQNPHIDKLFLTQIIEKSIKKKIDNNAKQTKGKYLGTSFQKSSGNKNVKRITTDTLLYLFNSNKLKFVDQFGGDKKKVLVSKLMKTINYWYDINEQNDQQNKNPYYLLMISFFRGEADFKFYSYNPRKKLIENTFDSKQNYNQYSFYPYSDYDIILFLETSQNQLFFHPDIEDSHFFLSVTRSQLQTEMQKIKKLKGENSYRIISVELPGNNFMVVDYNSISQLTRNKIDFKYSSLEDFASRIPAMQRKHSSTQFDNIGIQTKHLQQFFKSINWIGNIKVLRITQNKIKDIGVILQNCLNLEKLYFSENYVDQLNFTSQLVKLQTLHGSHNRIYKLKGLYFVKNLERLFMSKNLLEDLSKINQLIHLKVLSLQQNKLNNFSNILQASMPQLQQLFLSNQSQDTENISQTGNFINSLNSISIMFSNQKLFQWLDDISLFNDKQIKSNPISIKFKKLKLFQCSNNSHLFPEKLIKFQSQYLEKINLSNCFLQQISFPTINCIENLKYLCLRGNNLKSLNFLHPEQKNTNYSNKPQFSKIQNLSNEIYEIYENNSLIELDLTENKFEYLPIMRFSSLKMIKLAKNKIYNIESLSKSKLPQLQFLDLSQNVFSEICQLSLSKLKEIQLIKFEQLRCVENLFSRSHLETLEKITIAACMTDFSFNIKKQNNTLINLKQLYFKNVKFTAIKEQSLFQIESLKIMNWENCESNNFPIMKLQGLKQLKIYQQNCKVILKNLQKCDFPELQTLQIKQISIIGNGYSVSKINAPKLKQLVVKGLKILNMDQFLQNSNTKLQILSIVNSQVGNFSDHSIAKLKYIRQLYLININLTTFVCSEPLDNLLKLNLTNNKLKSFPRIKAKNLMYLELDKNGFEDISELEKCDLPLLQKIDLEGCQLSNSIFPKINLEGLWKLSLTKCKLKDVSNLTKSTLPQLKYLDLQDNKIESFPKITFPKLTSLDLKGNELRTQNLLDILELKTITDLRIGYQKLSQFSMILSLPKHLNLKHLKMLTIQNIRLEKLPSLEIPYLQGLRVWKCQLKDVHEFVKGQYKFLEQLDLYNNKIISIPKVFMQVLKIARFSCNKISYINEFLQSSLPSLERLNFKYNQLSNLNIMPFRSIKYLYLAGNQLTELNCFNLDEYPQLEQLNIEKSQLKEIKTFPRMPKLKRVSFSFSKLKDLNWLIESAENLPKLQNLLLQNNEITYLPNSLDKFPNLDNLNIWENPLKNVDGLISFHGLKNMQNLQLSLDLDDQQFLRIKNQLIKKNPRINVQKYNPIINVQESKNKLDNGETKFISDIKKALPLQPIDIKRFLI